MDDLTFSPCFPFGDPLSKPTNKRSLKARSQGTNQTARRGRWWRFWPPPQMIKGNKLPFSLFKNSHCQAESLELVLGHESTVSPHHWPPEQSKLSFSNQRLSPKYWLSRGAQPNLTAVTGLHHRFCSCSVTQSCPPGLQHARLPYPSPPSGACSNSCPLSRWCHPTILFPVVPFSSCPQSFPALGYYFKKLALRIREPKYWSFSFSISPSNEYSGLISFRIDWFDLLTVQGTLKSLLQHHNLKASILRCSAFFVVQFSHQYMTIEKAIALTIWTFVGKIMSLLFNMLSRFVIAFFQRGIIF